VPFVLLRYRSVSYERWTTTSEEKPSIKSTLLFSASHESQSKIESREKQQFTISKQNVTLFQANQAGRILLFSIQKMLTLISYVKKRFLYESIYSPNPKPLIQSRSSLSVYKIGPTINRARPSFPRSCLKSISWREAGTRYFLSLR